MRRAVVNRLTELFDNGNTPTVVDVLSNEDLSKSVTNEVPQLVDFICGDQEKKSHLQEFLEWALTTKHFSEQQHPFRFSQNAANVFSEPCNALQTRLREEDLLRETLDWALYDFLTTPPKGPGS
jgi:hypothetical protein